MRLKIALLTMAGLLTANLAFAAGVPYPFGGTPSSPLGPVQDPSQLFNYLNQLVNSINTNMMQANNSLAITGPSSGVAVANGITISGGGAGVGTNGPLGPTIAATGSDTNININLTTKGTGVLLAGNPTMWVPSKSLMGCPGYNTNTGGGNTAFGVNAYVQGYFLWADWLGRPHAVPGC